MTTAKLGDPLTPREREVLREMARGLSNKLIAVALNVSEHTAKFHVTAVCRKLGAATRTEAVVHYFAASCQGCAERLRELQQ